MDDKAFVNTGLEHLQHLVILHVVTYVFEDVTIRDYTQGTEDDPDRNVDLDVRNGRLHDIAQLQREYVNE